MSTTSLDRSKAARRNARPDLRWDDFPFRGSTLRTWLVWLVALTAVGAGIGLLIVGPLDGSIGAFDRNVSNWFGANRTAGWNDATWFGSTLADSYVKIPAAIILAGVFLFRWKRWTEAALLGGALILESTAFVAMSFIVDRSRPAIEQLDSIPPTGSFPSGHTAAAVVFYGAIALIVLAHSSNGLLRRLAVTAAVFVPLIVGVSRVYRGMHFVSDVVFGALLGMVSLYVTWNMLRDRGGSEAEAI